MKAGTTIATKREHCPSRRNFRVGIRRLAVVTALVIASSPATLAACEAGRLIEIRAPRGSIVATIAPERGGELVGLRVLSEGKWSEILYRGMDFCAGGGWVGKAPILWPGTGRNFSGDPTITKTPEAAFGWRWRGRELPMPIHGFARDHAWEVVEAGDKSVRLRLRENEQSLGLYPFRFRFDVEYRLGRNTLEMRHRILASPRNDAPMPFSIGNHITFRHPLLSGAEGVATVTSPLAEHVFLDAFGRPNGIETISPLERRPLSTFGRLAAYSLAGSTRTPEAQWDDPSGLSIHFSHWASRMPSGKPVLFNLWGDLGAGFFSVEPWLGRQNSLVTGDGLIQLEPGRTFDWTLRVRIDGLDS